MSKVASAWRHLASSSHQAASNCGPRSSRGLRRKTPSATAPFGHSRRRRDRRPARPLVRAATRAAARPAPSIITSRTSCSVSPTSAILRQAALAHRAACRWPARAPIPRRAASCRRRARPASARSSTDRRHWRTRRLLVPMRESREVTWRAGSSRVSSVGSFTNCLVSPARDERFNAARKFITEFIDIGWQCHSLIHRWEPCIAGAAVSATCE